MTDVDARIRVRAARQASRERGLSAASLRVPMLREGERDRRDQRRRAREPGAFTRAADRAAQDLRRPGGDRDRERAPVQRDQGGARAADGDGGDPARSSAARRPTRSRCSRRSCRAALRLFPDADGGVVPSRGRQVRAGGGRDAGPGAREAHGERFPIRCRATACTARRSSTASVIDVPDAEARQTGRFAPGVQNLLASGNRAITHRADDARATRRSARSA